MTKKRAMQILLDHAAWNIAGVGQGLRPRYSDEVRADVKQAMAIIWPLAYGGATISGNDYQNRGL